MVITDLLVRNAKNYRDEVSLVEINPETNKRHITWREFDLVEATEKDFSRTELTWGEFDGLANKFANMLLNKGLGKGSKVAILMMNCL
jgi:acyl-CoA synthetase (AMP-forming)/AMP-acid ligase II